MSERATVDVFAVAPRTPGEVRFHITGGVLNGTATLSGLVWVLATWREHAPAWPWVLLAILAGIYVADLVSGLLHWAFDTWFDEDIALSPPHGAASPRASRLPQPDLLYQLSPRCGYTVLDRSDPDRFSPSPRGAAANPCPTESAAAPLGLENIFVP